MSAFHETKWQRMNKYSVEFIGSFFLTLSVVLSANNPDIAPLAPIAIGATLVAMTYAGKQLSGAHFNPAITLAAFMRGNFERNDALMYIIVQVLGGAAAAALGVYLHGVGGGAEIGLHSNADQMGSLLAELLGSFILAFVFLNVAATEQSSINTHQGLALGFSLIAASYTFGNISGGAFNPAVAVGGTIAGMYSGADLWIYLVGSLAGGAAAATVFFGIFGQRN